MATSSENHVADKHCEFTCPVGAVAQIPWIPKQDRVETPFAESAFHRELISNGDDGKYARSVNKELMFQTLAEAFPFYLPARYHSMDAMELHKHATFPGSYWTNAIHFVRTCSDYDTIPYYNMDIELSLSDQPRMEKCEIKSNHCKFQDFTPSGLEQCKTPEEFLFDPWVILQLPFQPALWHQWTVAALAVHLEFSKSLVGIGSRGYLPKFKELFNRLIVVGETLEEHLGNMFAHFFRTCKQPAETLKTRLNKYKHWSDYDSELADILALLKFVASQECNDILEFIRSNSWNKNAPPSTLLVSHQLASALCSKYSDFLNIYNQEYWTDPLVQAPCVRMPEGNGDKLEKIDQLLSIPAIFARKHPAYADPSRELTTEGRSLLQEIIASSGCLTNMQNSEEFFENPMRHMASDDLPLFLYYADKVKYCRDMLGPVKKGGVLHDILSLKLAVECEESFGIMCNSVWRAAENFDKQLYLHADTSSRFSIQDLINKIDSAMEEESPWTYTGLISKIEKMARFFENGKSPIPLNLGASVVDLIEHFTGRIQRCMIRIYMMQNMSWQICETMSYPEKHFVQYILPCFVAMIVDVDNDRALDSTTKENYRRLVNNLIESFEQNKLHQEFSNQRTRYFHTEENFDEYLLNSLSEVVSTLKNFFEKSPDMQKIFGKFEYFSVPFAEALPIASSKPDSAEHSLLGLFHPIDSKVQLSTFCLRLKTCLAKAGVSKSADPEFGLAKLVALLKVLSPDPPSDIVRALSNLTSKSAESLSGEDKKHLEPVLQGLTKLSEAQVFHLALFLIWKVNVSEEKFFLEYQQPLFLLDKSHQVMQHLLKRDCWNLRSTFASFTCGYEDLIPIDVALKNVCCKPVLKSLTGNKRVKMSKPGEVTFCPIKHCRWCGVVYARPFRLCPECKDEPQYPDPNFFCTERCERTALEKYHTEEHAKFVMEKLGIRCDKERVPIEIVTAECT